MREEKKPWARQCLLVGDLVRFVDCSSGSDSGDGLFPHFDGRIGLIVALSTSPSGNPMATFRDGSVEETFNEDYFEVLLNG